MGACYYSLKTKTMEQQHTNESNLNRESGGNTSRKESAAAPLSNNIDPNPLYGPADGSLPEYKETSDSPSATTDERDRQIKNEPDTARLRSERQSVIDGENNKNE